MSEPIDLHAVEARLAAVDQQRLQLGERIAFADLVALLAALRQGKRLLELRRVGSADVQAEEAWLNDIQD